MRIATLFGIDFIQTAFQTKDDFSVNEYPVRIHPLSFGKLLNAIGEMSNQPVDIFIRNEEKHEENN